MAQELYTLEVRLLEGPVTDTFVERNPTVSRTIQVRGDQTLAQLHRAIFRAFGFWDDCHLYEFQFGEGPYDCSGGRYVVPSPVEFPFDVEPPPTGTVDKTRLCTLGLEVGRSFGYWYDFGDCWCFKLDIVAVGEAEPKRRYPRVIARTGESPPQYLEPDEGDDDEDEADLAAGALSGPELWCPPPADRPVGRGGP